MGRFINADGLVVTGQGIIGNNMFAYCGNEPVGRIDSEGTRYVAVSQLMCGGTKSGTKDNSLDIEKEKLK